VMQSSAKETTQFVWSYEVWMELRKTKYDDTGILTGATSI